MGYRGSAAISMVLRREEEPSVLNSIKGQERHYSLDIGVASGVCGMRGNIDRDLCLKKDKGIFWGIEKPTTWGKLVTRRQRK